MFSAPNSRSIFDRAGRIVLGLVLFALVGLASTGLSGVSPAWAGPGLSISSASDKGKNHIRPGDVFTMSVRIGNEGEGPGRIHTEMLLPSGWRSVLGPSDFEIDPGGVNQSLMVISVPAGTPAGEYRVICKARGEGVEVSTEVSVQVASVAGLRLLPVPLQETLLAGESTKTEVQVFNEGNASARIRLDARAAEGLEAQVEPRELELPARSGGIAVLEIRASRALVTSSTLPVRVVARSGALRSGPEEVAIILVPVLPRSPSQAHLTHDIPSVLRGMVMTEGPERAAQFELKGKGPAQPGRPATLDYLAREPDARGETSFGQQDELRINYRQPGFSLLLGDQNYSLSQLLSPSRYGRGVEVDASQGPVELRAQRVTPHGDPSGQTANGASVGLRLPHGIRPSLNLLALQPEETGALEAMVVSMLTRARVLSATDIEAEYGFDLLSKGRPEDRQAMRVLGDGMLGSVAYTALYLRAGPDFSGASHDVSATAATASAPIFADGTLQASFQTSKKNLEDDVERGAATIRNQGQARVIIDIARSVDAATGVRVADGTDPLGMEADFREAGVILGTSLARSHFSLGTEGLVGIHEDSEGTKQAFRMVARGAWRLSEGLRFGLNGIWTPEGATNGVLFNSCSSVVITAAAKAGSHMNLDTSLQRSWGESEFLRWDSRVVYNSLGRWLAEVRYRYGERENVQEHAAFLSVSMAFGMPISTNRTIGVVQGRVFDEEAPGRPGLARIPVMAEGRGTLTDAQGRYLLADLAPGPHSVDVALRGQGYEKVSRDSLPLPVVVKGGEVSILDIPVTTGSAIHGVLRVERPAASGKDSGIHPAVVGNGADQQEGGIPGATLLLTDGVMLLMCLTDTEGRFSFEGLRPGTWTLTVRQDRLPAQHEVEGPVRDLVLESGETEEISVVVRPRVRKIRMLDPGVLVRP